MDARHPTTEEGGLSPKLVALRFKLGQKAKREPDFRFYSLYGHLLRMDVLRAAFARVAASKGRKTPGVDGVTVDHIVNAEDGVDGFLATVREELRAKDYRPQAVKRVYIPKANGKQRPLGIPSVRDRLVQTALLLILEPIFEADFLPCSYGFRPGRSAHGAVEEIRENLHRGYTAVYDADLKGYFDSIPHDKLMKGIEQRIADGSVLKLIRRFLRAPIVEAGKAPRRPTSGTPQGGVISPLLANSYLHWFDRTFHSRMGPAKWAGARLVRYADDFVVMAKRTGQRLVEFIEEKIEHRLGLELNREKTRILQVKDKGEILNFLGYSFRYSRSHRPGGGPRYWRVEASRDARKRARAEIHELTSSRRCFVPVEKVIADVNRFMRGWLAYYKVGHPANARFHLVRYAESRVVQHLRRRSQRPYRPPDGVSLHQHVRDLGLLPVTARPG